MKSETRGKDASSQYEKAFSSFINRSIKRLKRQPYLLLPALIAYMRGLYYRLKFRLLLKKVKIGPHFRVYGRLIITGPGSVDFGKDCFILSHMTKTVCLTTQLPHSKIILGDHVGLNGTSIVCFDQISIDDYCNIADAYITDSSAHPLSPDRRLYNASDIPAERVHIEKNVWISTHVVVLKGVRIGENSVIGALSLVRNHLPANVLATGVPAKPIKELPIQAVLSQNGLKRRHEHL